MTTLETSAAVWVDAGPLETFTYDRGAAVLADGHQVAVFVLGDGSVHAVDNHDPISQANVLSRGLVGDAGGVPFVASPVYKQRFDLTTGRCLDDPERAVAVHEVRIAEGRVQVRRPA